ncbi:MAG TPA: peptidoglycan editing factor PgeF [Bacillota bacterium]|nr:peptidoglycan editing factor PgeF [Bacillota bacterium]
MNGIIWKKKNSTGTLFTREENGVYYLGFKALAKTGLVKHGFSTRLGGVSEGCYSTMNLSFTTGDKKENVEENLRRMGDALGTMPSGITAPYQAHTVNVRRVGERDKGKGITREKDPEETDGLMTDVPGLMLVTGHADCLPLYIVDTERRAIALSHSGWKGTAHRIGQMTLLAMKKEFGTQPENVIVGIGPGICEECYEVGENVAVEVRMNFNKESWHEILIQKKEFHKGSLDHNAEGHKYMMDLSRANEIIFEEAGVKKENIHTADICTMCNSDLLFSHRKMGKKRGGQAAFLCLE